MHEVPVQPSHTDGEYEFLQRLVQNTELSSCSELRFGGDADLCLRDISPLKNLKLSQRMSTEFKALLKPLEHPACIHLGKEVV